MAHDSKGTIDHPARLCEAIIELIDELEASDVIEPGRASELRSEVYRSVDVHEDGDE